MCCPFAKRCPTFETFTCEGNQHLAWAFCLGEYRDCDRYKCTVAACASSGAGESGLDRHLVDEKERILGRLRANLFDPPAKAR
jgi:hypothetical protein